MERPLEGISMSDAPDFDLTDLARQFAEPTAAPAAPGLVSQALEDLVRDGQAEQDRAFALDQRPQPAPTPTLTPPPLRANAAAAALAPAEADADAASAADLLDMLHQDYLRALVDPTLLSQQSAWASIDAAQSVSHADPLDDLKRQAADTHSLYELLSPLPAMDDVLNSLDTGLGDARLLAEVSHDSVLHLLAPPHLQAAQADSELLAALLASDVPSLTLKEHHDLSLDSALSSLFARPEGPTP
ncbi:MAG: hypothetical protein C4K60_14360 [Ideonella sp. MAG2]|nr:MAG: hypothetical protein C4K60_14360 [Ideonella sp. MAG2]